MTLSRYLHIVNPSAPCDTFPEKPATEFSFPLDPFQQHAIAAISRHENVLVTAKTGSGKTLVGEYQIAESLAKGRRVFYTTPIKSLSNQKFHDLKQLWPGRVGIMTGDIKFQPEADIVIMTTEILRNLLFKYDSTTRNLGLTSTLSLENLDAVVFDEVHYINNKERGRVWEETLILLPQTVNLVLLSATIDSPELFASWLGNLKQKPIHLISTTYRIVPLTHAVLRGKNPYTIMDHKEEFYPRVYNDWLAGRKENEDNYRKFKKQVAGREAGDPSLHGVKKPATFANQMNETIRTLEEKELLPALFFVFSRKSCEVFAKKVEGSLLTSSDSAAVKHILDFHLHKFPAIYNATAQYFALSELLQRGIAYHHSGVLPILKEMIEILFAKGFVKVLFATETFAVGINMPTKVAIFTSFEKYDDAVRGLRTLYTDEYIQMAGRAGRRGKDKEGLVLYLPEREPVGLHELQGMMTGAKSSFVSRMSFHYDFLLKTMQSGKQSWLALLKESYWYQQHIRGLEAARTSVNILSAKQAALGLTDVVREDMELRETLEATMKGSVNAARKDAQRKYSEWQNKHMGPTHLKNWETYKAWKQLASQKSSAEKEIADIESYTDSITPLFSAMKEMGILEEENGTMKLTERGILATEVNEGHPILMVRAFEEGICAGFTGPELLCFLAAFTGERESDNSPSLSSLRVPAKVLSAFYNLDDYIGEYYTIERKNGVRSPDNYWNLNTQWIEPVWRWLTEEGVKAGGLCEEYEIYEGNFVRIILKVSNLLEEWTNLAIYTKNMEMLRIVEGLSSLLVRDLVVPESLYLRI
jgi:superfamily II RNA helicase